jgi:hypothetical protein
MVRIRMRNCDAIGLGAPLFWGVCYWGLWFCSVVVGVLIWSCCSREFLLVCLEL